MKKTLLILYCALFIGVCTFFSLGTLIPGASDAAEGDAVMPEFFTSPPNITINSDFGDQFEKYFQKKFAYRNKVVDSFAFLKTSVFSEGNEQVIVGKDDFLFFDDTLDNYMGTNRMTDAEIEAAADALCSMNEISTEHGAKFIFVCAPNKNSIYPEMMPSRYKMNNNDRDLDRLYDMLDVLGVSYVDLRPIFMAEKENTLLYHKRDTHWNTDGARIAYETISDALGVSYPDFSMFDPTAVNDHVGDLDTLLFPSRKMYDDNTVYDLTGSYIFTTAYSTPMDLRIATRGSGENKLLFFRDSFANAMIPFAAASFSEVRFERASPYCENIDLLDSFEADYVIVLIAERNLRNLIKNSENNT